MRCVAAVYRPQWKKADLKTAIITKRTKNNNNDNNNNSNSNENNNNKDNNNKGSSKNTNNNNNNNNNNINNNNIINDINNPFKVACPQSLVHSDQKQTIFKKKAQQTFRIPTEEKRQRSAN